MAIMEERTSMPRNPRIASRAPYLVTATALAAVTAVHLSLCRPAFAQSVPAGSLFHDQGALFDSARACRHNAGYG